MVHEWSDGPARQLAASTVETEARSLVLRGQCHEGWTYVVQWGERVSLPIRVPVGGCSGSALPLKLVPRAHVGGVVVAPRGSRLPGWARLELATCGSPEKPQGFPVGPYPVEVRDDGSWSAVVPAGCLQLQLAVMPFAPVGWKGLRLSIGETVQLGRSHLREGATVLLPVVSGLDGRPAAGAQVDLVREEEAQRAAVASYEGGQVLSELRVRSDRTGLALLRGVPAGTYYLRVRAAEVAASFVFVGPVLVEGTGEIRLEPALLPVPATLRVGFDLPQNLPPPAGLRLSATPYLHGQLLLRAERRQDLEPGEEVRFDALPPGTWDLAVEWRDGRGTSYEIAEQDVEVPPGLETDTRIDLVRHLFRGRAFRGGEGIESTLDLRPEWDGFSGGVPRVRTAEDGEFLVFLPQPGFYAVIVHDRGGAVQTLVPDVDFRAPERRVEVRWPEGRIEGYVEDPDGTRVPGVTVAVEARLDWAAGSHSEVPLPPFPVFAQTDEEGRFVLEDLARGTWSLSAAAADLRSAVLPVVLGSDQTVTGVHLELAPSVRFAGRVTTSSGAPVVGARGAVQLPPRVAGEVPPAVELVTDRDGRFSVALPPGSRGPVNLEIDGSGFARTVERVPPAEGLEIHVATQGGRVSFQRKKGRWRGRELFRLVLVGPGGAFMPVVRQIGRAGALSGEGGYILPNLAPGHWRVVESDESFEASRLLTVGAGFALPLVAEIDVFAGSSQDVTLDPPSPRNRSHESGLSSETGDLARALGR